MRKFNDGAHVRRASTMGASLLVLISLSGCATNGARHEASLYPNNRAYQMAQLRPKAPAPVPAVRGYRERLASVETNDERKYAAIYNVAPRPEYVANAQMDREAEPAPLPRRTTTPRRAAAPYNRETVMANAAPGSAARTAGRSTYMKRNAAAWTRTNARARNPASNIASNKRSAATRRRATGYKHIIVTRGDTLYNIAWRYKTTMGTLLRVNKLRYSNLEIGQQLMVPVRR